MVQKIVSPFVGIDYLVAVARGCSEPVVGFEHTVRIDYLR